MAKAVCVSCVVVAHRTGGGLTWVGNADANVPALELRLAKSESLLQAVDSAEGDITEALGSAIKLVLDDTDAGDFASRKEVLYIVLGDFERKVAQMGRVRGLGGKRKFLTDSVALETGRS